jgi:hypothetical protein
MNFNFCVLKQHNTAKKQVTVQLKNNKKAPAAAGAV